MNYSVHSRSQFHVKSHGSISAFWIVFVTRHKVFDIFNVLVDSLTRTERGLPLPGCRSIVTVLLKISLKTYVFTSPGVLVIVVH